LLRVAVLSPAAELGGAERSLLTFLKASQGKLVDARVILPREGPLGQALARLQVPWEVVPMPLAVRRFSRQQGNLFPAWASPGILQAIEYAARLRRRLSHLAPEVIYTNGIKSHVVGALLRPWVRSRIIWHLRDFWEGRYVGFLADRGPHAIIANSRATAKSLQKRMKYPDKITLVYNAVDLEEFSPTGPLPLPEYWAGYSHRVGIVGAFARWKGHSLFFDAVGIVGRKFPQAGFFVVGGEIYDSGGEAGFSDYLNRLVHQAGLQGRVVFTGFQADVAPWYRVLDVVVNASLKPEPFGRSLLEAMACGRTVVGPRGGGVPEFVHHGGNGLLYEMGQPGELATAILSLLKSPSLRTRLGNAGRDTALRFFSPEGHATIMTQLFRDVIR
jgi:glycosyltransferase involved in cell wall biosynthesis